MLFIINKCLSLYRRYKNSFPFYTHVMKTMTGREMFSIVSEFVENWKQTEQVLKNTRWNRDERVEPLFLDET